MSEGTIEKTCGCCGCKFEAAVPPASDKEGDWFDLDQRPPEPMRSDLYRQIFRCPQCGAAVGPRLRRAPEDFVKSEQYTTCEGNDLPEGCGADYYRLGMTAERDGDLATAFEAFLRAAWVFDDAADDASAVKCRCRCIALGEKFPPTSGYETLVRVDIYRRAGKWNDIPQKVLSERYPDSLTNLILEFEKKLARKGDTKAYNLEQCFAGLGIKR